MKSSVDDGWTGGDAAIRFVVKECSLGRVLVAQSSRGICAVLLGDDAGELQRELTTRFAALRIGAGGVEMDAVALKVVAFLESTGDDSAKPFDMPLDLDGPAFQQRVWNALREIPPGQTATYREIAQRIGSLNAVRAVGQACGANVLAVVVPCHRVVRSDGALSGYRWGVARKRLLLERERGASLSPGNCANDHEGLCT
jgi:AraC family transcriptional regulator of adaptative response/methylated-DNA-[protein]-cysteine methyltransferase